MQRKMRNMGLWIVGALLLVGGMQPAQGQASASTIGGHFKHLAAPPPPVWPPTDSAGGDLKTNCIRFWDDGVKWNNLETSSGVYGGELTTLTNFLSVTMPNYPYANCIIYVFGDVPAWAAQGTDSNCSATQGSSSCVPPNDMDTSQSTCNATPNSGGTQNSTVLANCGNGPDTQWRAFVYKMVTEIQANFAGTIYFELWNEPDGAGNFWSNAAAYGGLGHAPSRVDQPPLVRLLELNYDAAQIITQTCPACGILSDSVHGPSASSWLPLLLGTSHNNPGCTGSCSTALGGATWAAATVSGAQMFSTFNIWLNAHLRGQTNNGDPTEFLTVYNQVAAEWSSAGLRGPCIFNDEYGPVGSSQFISLNNTAAYAAIELALNASVSNPAICQSNWYQIDNGTYILQGTTAGLAFDTVAGWEIGATASACTTAGTIWSCPVVIGGSHELIVWDSSQTCPSTCTTGTQNFPSYTTYTTIFNTTGSLGGGGSVALGLQPLLLAAPGPPPPPTESVYVDNVGGSDSNSGTSPSAPWQHLYKVREQSFGPSSAVYLKRGDVWYGQLAFYGTRAVVAQGASTADGTATAPFIVDAYGSGAPPTLNAEYPTPSSSWSGTCVSHICSINTGGFPEGAPARIDMVKFGSVWGVCKGANVAIYCPTTGGTAALTADYQFNFNTSTGMLAVYDDIGTNPVADYGGIGAVIDGETQILDIDGVNYVSVQHLKLLNQSWYGLEYRGTAGTDHLVAANLYSDTEVPFNLHGTGFYIHPTANSADLSFYNDEAHRGFYGFSFECGALPCTSSNSVLTATLANVKAYFNRSYGLNDATYTGTAAHYSYAHFYGNQIKWPIVGDVNGGVAGTNVLSNLVDPAVKAWKLYTPRVALNFGDVGAQNGADTAFNNYAAALGSAPVSVGVATNFPVVPSLVTEIQGWVTAGYDISLLGLSDTSYQNLNVLSVQCASATSATLTISGTTLSTSVTGGSCTPVSYSLTSSSYLTIQQVEFALRAAGYTATLPQPCGACSWLNGSAMLSVDLAAVSAANIKASPYTLQFNPVTFLNSELSGAKAWVTANLTGTSGKYVYWYPGLLFCNVATNCPGISPSNPEAYTVSNGYDMARGALSMQAGADGIQGGYDLVAAAGVDAHGMVACEMGGWNSLTPTQLAETIQVLAEKSAVWGVPYLCYFQPGSFSNVQLARVIADLGTSGITLMTDSALATFLEAKKNIPAGGTYWAWAPDGAAASAGYDGTESYLSPTVGTGSTLASTYQLDVWGRLQAQFRAGWDMGATVLVPVYLGLKPGH
jgi:hypothetical protein